MKSIVQIAVCAAVAAFATNAAAEVIEETPYGVWQFGQNETACQIQFTSKQNAGTGFQFVSRKDGALIFGTRRANDWSTGTEQVPLRATFSRPDGASSTNQVTTSKTKTSTGWWYNSAVGASWLDALAASDSLEIVGPNGEGSSFIFVGGNAAPLDRLAACSRRWTVD